MVSAVILIGIISCGHCNNVTKADWLPASNLQGCCAACRKTIETQFAVTPALFGNEAQRLQGIGFILAVKATGIIALAVACTALVNTNDGITRCGQCAAKICIARR